MADGESSETIARLAVLEVQQRGIEEDLREVRADIRDIKAAMTAAGAGLSRSEKIALTASGSAVVGAIIGVVALLTGGP